VKLLHGIDGFKLAQKAVAIFYQLPAIELPGLWPYGEAHQTQKNTPD
jgi:hypothetical protein